MPVSRLRLGAIAAGLSLLLAVGGYAREVGRFGWSDASAIGHIEQELARRVVERARALQERASRVARESALVAAATASRDSLPELFASLARPLATGDDNTSSTVWIPAGSAGGYRVLAWSGSPAEDVAAEQVAGPDGGITHSSFIYLIDRKGRLRALMPYGRPPADYVHDLRILLASP